MNAGLVASTKAAPGRIRHLRGQPALSIVDPVADILAHHGIREPWAPLTATGIANRIYATSNVVLRIATDHPEGVDDARTESVAAPVARAAGVLVPRLLAFDDSRALVDRPYSIWERIHGETLGLLPRDPRRDLATWHAVGRELARLHRLVRQCADPHGWLDDPGRELDLDERVVDLASAARIDAATAKEITGWIDALRPAVVAPPPRGFLHNDIHDMNVMCSRDGSLLAILDWGDAGWGDPALEFAQAPLAAVPAVLAGYESEAAELPGECPEARILWDRLDYALHAAQHDRRPLDELLQFARTADARWRRSIR
jgi:aminoglycoside phosphotransferase (APT) family kinase protein